MIESEIRDYLWLSICIKASKVKENQKQVGKTSVWKNMFGAITILCTLLVDENIQVGFNWSLPRLSSSGAVVC